MLCLCFCAFSIFQCFFFFFSFISSFLFFQCVLSVHCQSFSCLVYSFVTCCLHRPYRDRKSPVILLRAAQTGQNRNLKKGCLNQAGLAPPLLLCSARRPQSYPGRTKECSEKHWCVQYIYQVGCDVSWSLVGFNAACRLNLRSFCVSHTRITAKISAIHIDSGH